MAQATGRDRQNLINYGLLHQALIITFVYSLIGSLYILLSDELVKLLVKEQALIININIIKSWIYLLITSILIFFLVYIAMKKVVEKNDILDKSNMLFLAILESSPQVIIFALDNRYCYLAFNNKHKEVMQQIWGKEIKIGMNMLEVIGRHEDRIKAKESFDKALAGESFSLMEEYGDDKLERLFWQDYYSPVFSNNGEVIGLTCFVLNITARKKAEEEIIYLSYHDALTGLYNRRFYEEEIRRLDTERNLPISIIMGDVNGLKLINDAFGHDKGDELLQKAALIIQSACRTDDIIARWGGDEFVILLPNTKKEEAEKIVNRIKDLYTNEYINSLRMSISFGVDTKKKYDEDIIEVLKSAEDYMYKHKMIENSGERGNSVNTILKALHDKRPGEEQHSNRVRDLCQRTGKALGYSEVEISKLKTAGLLHDIGKIAIDDKIFNKTCILTGAEQEEIKRHPDIGYRIISSAYNMMDLADCILAHHESWDGTGYPKGLKGEEIPVAARIVAIADYYDAMTSNLPYRKAFSGEEAILKIKNNAGKKFDPEITKVFIEKVLDKPDQADEV